jgi:hypothetical protein
VAALPVCRRLHQDPARELASAARRGLARLDPSAIVDELDAATTGPADLAEVLPDLALTALGDGQLAVLAAILLRCFPLARDPAPQFGRSRTDGLFQVRGTRNHVLERLTHGGQAGALEKLAGQSEDDITDWLRRQLRSRLTIATTIDREVQVERGQRGFGTRIDLTVTAPAAVHQAAAVRVITEAKLVTNETLMTAMHD